jgi:hypothetical protein
MLPPCLFYKIKIPLAHTAQEAGQKLAVPLSFFTQKTGNGANPGGITRRAPGRTSHPAAADPLSAGEGSSLSGFAVLLFPFFAPVTGQYIIIS